MLRDAATKSSRRRSRRDQRRDGTLLIRRPLLLAGPHPKQRPSGANRSWRLWFAASVIGASIAAFVGWGGEGCFVVPKPGFEPGRGCPQRCLRPPRLPFRHFGAARNRNRRRADASAGIRLAWEQRPRHDAVLRVALIGPACELVRRLESHQGGREVRAIDHAASRAVPLDAEFRHRHHRAAMARLPVGRRAPGRARPGGRRADRWRRASQGPAPRRSTTGCHGPAPRTDRTPRACREGPTHGAVMQTI